MEKSWHKQQEQILKMWGEASACYRYMHYMAFRKLKHRSMMFSLPIIIISTVTGTASFAHETFPPSWRYYVPLGIGSLNLFAGVLATVMQFLKVNELMESHRASSIGYSKLSRQIRLELSLPVYQRNYSGSDMLNMCQNDYDRLIEQSPAIPTDILLAFKKEFPDCEEESNGTRSKIYLPEILSVHPIEPYDGAYEEELQTKVASQFRKRLASRGALPDSFADMPTEIVIEGTNATGNVNHQSEKNQIEQNNSSQN